MQGTILDKGNFEIFETERGRSLLVLNEVRIYVWAKEDKRETLRLTEGITEKSDDVHPFLAYSGPYFIVAVEDDPIFPGLSHLYLRHEDHYDEFILQDGLPDLESWTKQIVDTHRIIPAEELETFIYEHSGL